MHIFKRFMALKGRISSIVKTKLKLHVGHHPNIPNDWRQSCLLNKFKVASSLIRNFAETNQLFVLQICEALKTAEIFRIYKKVAGSNMSSKSQIYRYIVRDNWPKSVSDLMKKILSELPTKSCNGDDASVTSNYQPQRFQVEMYLYHKQILQLFFWSI